MAIRQLLADRPVRLDVAHHRRPRWLQVDLRSHALPLRLRERRKEIDKLARKHAKKYTLYHLRYSWATRALRNGVDPLTVAILLGHSNPKMLAEVYQHLAQGPEHLRSAAERAVS